MPFTPLTEEQYNKAIQSGFSPDQIIEFEKQRKASGDTAQAVKQPQTVNQKIDQQIANRPSAIADLVKNPTTIQHPLGAVLRTLSGASELYQGVPASIGLDLQAGRPQDILGNLVKVATGQRPAQYGDIFRGANVPEPVSATGGIILDMASAPGGKQAIEGAGNFIGNIGKKSREVGQAIKMAQKEFGAIRKEDLVRKMGDAVKNVRDNADARLSRLNDILNQEVNKKLPIFRDSLKRYFSNNSKIYGDKLDDISNNLAKNGQSITRGELKQILDDVNAQAQEQFIASGKPFEELTSLRNKYRIDEITIDSPILNERGSPIQTVIKNNLSDPLNFKEVVEDIKKVKNALSSKVKLGYRYQPEDIVASKLMSRWGDYVSTKVPEFAQLNKEYKPIIDAMNAAGKEFKPYSSDFDIKGVEALKNLALGKNKGQVDKDKLLQFIENGTQNFPGVGNFTSRLRNIGKAINDTDKSTDYSIRALLKRKSTVEDLLSQDAKFRGNVKKVLKVGGAVGLGIEETVGPKLIRRLVGN